MHILWWRAANNALTIRLRILADAHYETDLRRIAQTART